MKQVKLSEFIAYLEAQVGSAYVWGAQGQIVTPDDYKAFIARRESDAAHRAKAERYCEKRFAEGAAELRCFDCSGLGMYYLQGRVYDHDMTANGMMGQCTVETEPRKGYWVFRAGTTGRATHIGYMVSDTELIEAKGRAYGVVRTVYRKKDWNVIGKPKCVDFEEEPQPGKQYVLVKGNVRVREGNGTKTRCIGIAHKGDLLPYLGQASDAPNWYEVTYNGQRGYISSNQKYTEIVNK